MLTSFLDKLRNPNYSFSPVGRSRETDLVVDSALRNQMRRPAVIFGQRKNPGGAINQLGQQPQEQIHVPGQTAPNVIYNPQPEQFEREMKLREKQLDNQNKILQANMGRQDFDAETRRMNALTNQGRMTIQQFKAENPNLIIRATAGGNYMAINPQTGDVRDTGIPVGNMSQEDAINLRGKLATDLEDIRQANRRDLQEDRQRHDVATTIFKESNNIYRSRPKPNPLAKAFELYNTDPAVRPFIQFSDDGKTFTLKAPGATTKSFWGTESPDPNAPSVEQFEKLKQMIYGSDTSAPPQFQPDGFTAKPGEFEAKPGQFDAKPGQFTTSGGNQPKMVQMITPDGETIEVPEDEVKEAEALGAKKVGSKIGETKIAPGVTGKLPAGQTGKPPAGQVR